MSRYERVIFVRHPHDLALKTIAEADLVLLSYAHLGQWHVVKDRHGDYQGKGFLTKDDVGKLLA